VSARDCRQRFLFEDAPVRGHWVRLTESWREAAQHQQLPDSAMSLLGEALVAGNLLAATLKFTGTLTLQLSGGEGLLGMLVAQATNTRSFRGCATLTANAQSQFEALPVAPFGALVGKGNLIVSVEQGAGIAPWQGVVSLQGACLAQCLEKYFAESEQLPSALVLAANRHHAAGLLLQRLPHAEQGGEAAAGRALEIWEELTMMLATVRTEELLELAPEVLLQRLFNERDIRLYEAESLQFRCRCDRARVASMLASMGRAEIEAMVAEQGAITVTCEFCQQPYRFDAVDAQQLFVEPAALGAGREIN
jgi:molecular chaperone Hsp33